MVLIIGTFQTPTLYKLRTHMCRRYGGLSWNSAADQTLEKLWIKKSWRLRWVKGMSQQQESTVNLQQSRCSCCYIGFMKSNCLISTAQADNFCSPFSLPHPWCGNTAEPEFDYQRTKIKVRFLRIYTSHNRKQPTDGSQRISEVFLSSSFTCALFIITVGSPSHNLPL